MNLYKREIYKKSLQHAERRNHKYLYKIGDRYIYPEDVADKAKSTASNIGSMATAAGTATKIKASSLKEKASNTINEKKQLLKDKKYVRDSKQKKSDSYETLVSKHPYARQIQQLTSAHQTSTKRTGNGLYDSREHKETPSVEKQKQKTKARATEKRTEAGVKAARERKEKKDIDSKYGREALIKSALDRGERDFREKRYAIAQEYDHQKRSEDAKKRQEQKKRNISSSRQITNAHQVATKNARDFYPKDVQDSRGIDVMNRVNPVPKSIDKKRTAEATKKRTENGVEAGRKRAFKRPGNQTRIDLNPGVNKAREKRWSRENHEVYEDYGAGSRYDKEANQINSAHRGSTSIEARTLDNNRRRGYGLRRFKRRITH